MDLLHNHNARFLHLGSVDSVHTWSNGMTVLTHIWTNTFLSQEWLPPILQRQKYHKDITPLQVRGRLLHSEGDNEADKPFRTKCDTSFGGAGTVGDLRALPSSGSVLETAS